MREGKLSISRGTELATGPAEPRLTLVTTPSSERPAEGQISPSRIDERLTALERLAALRSHNLLTDEEYAAEKALVRGVSPGEPLAGGRQGPALSIANPSLVGRIFSWKFIPIGLVAGLALSFGAQPRETIRFFDQALLFFGA